MRRIPALLFILIAATNATAQSRVEKNLIYGMYSGLALLMDVHHPDRPNGYGVIFVGGSGWQAPTSYGAVGLKEGQASQWVPPLLAAGYTVFAINHRAAPRFHYPAAVEDVQRAVRFIRHGAPKLGINPNRIGGVGGSSGAHLLALVAMLGAPGTAGDGDGVNREPATLQCVVLRAGPSDLRQMIGSSGLSTAAVVSFMERAPTPNADDQKAYRAASPIEHVSPTAPPALLLHGDADDTVPYQQSVALETKLRSANVPVKLVRVPGGAHGPDFGVGGKPHPQLSEVFTETVRWLDTHLRGAPESK